ncbi:MAG: hypothetical protein PHF00_02875 [Elusimicrobia bacterium]|nr:hypothetical protein [Elusimicrobiota bacterium]
MKLSGQTVLAAAAWLALGPAAAWAVSSDAGTAGGQFLKLQQGSARAMALGQAYVALSEGCDALTWNPAGLAATQQREAVYSYLRHVQDIDSPLYMAYAHPMGRTVWGGNIAYLSVDGFDVRDENGVPQPGADAAVRDGFGSVGAARSFWYEKLFLGAAIRVVHEDIAGSVHDNVVGDVGALFKPNSVLSLGFAVQNFGSGLENAAAITRGGAAVRLGDFFDLSLEVSKAADASSRVGLGGEFQLPEQYLDVGQISFRAGYYSADNRGQNLDSGTLKDLRLDRTSSLTFGFGLFTSRAFGYGVALDYAFVPFGALGTVDQISLKVKF